MTIYCIVQTSFVGESISCGSLPGIARVIVFAAVILTADQPICEDAASQSDFTIQGRFVSFSMMKLIPRSN